MAKELVGSLEVRTGDLDRHQESEVDCKLIAKCPTVAHCSILLNLLQDKTSEAPNPELGW